MAHCSSIVVGFIVRAVTEVGPSVCHVLGNGDVVVTNAPAFLSYASVSRPKTSKERNKVRRWGKVEWVN